MAERPQAAARAQIPAILCNFSKSWGKSIHLLGVSFVFCERVTDPSSQVPWGNETG